MMPGAYSEPCQQSKIECFAKIVNTKKLLTNFANSSILGILQGYKYPPGYWNLFLPISII